MLHLRQLYIPLQRWWEKCETIQSIEAKAGSFQNWAIDTVIKHSISGFIWPKPHLPTSFGYKVREYLCCLFSYLFLLCFTLCWPPNLTQIFKQISNFWFLVNVWVQFWVKIWKMYGSVFIFPKAHPYQKNLEYSALCVPK